MGKLTVSWAHQLTVVSVTKSPVLFSFEVTTSSRTDVVVYIKVVSVAIVPLETSKFWQLMIYPVMNKHENVFYEALTPVLWQYR